MKATVDLCVEMSTAVETALYIDDFYRKTLGVLLEKLSEKGFRIVGEIAHIFPDLKATEDSRSEQLEFLVTLNLPVMINFEDLRSMIEEAERISGSVIPAEYGIATPNIGISDTGTVAPPFPYLPSIVVSHLSSLPFGYGTFFLSEMARAFHFKPCIEDDIKELEKVTTIVRFHESAEIKHLWSSVYSLMMQSGCRVKVLLCCQSLSTHKKKLVEQVLLEIPKREGFSVELMDFHGISEKEDLRSEMLNQGLLRATSRYVAFLDYDDVIFFSAYEYLLARLKITEAAISFGRVWQTLNQTGTNRLHDRSPAYTHGYTFKDFQRWNFIPLHSFLIDLDKVDRSRISYFADMTYLEDYYLLLQIIKPQNGDWRSLSENKYIGDYIVLGSGGNTLNLTSTNNSWDPHGDAKYLESVYRIKRLKRAIRSASFRANAN